MGGDADDAGNAYPFLRLQGVVWGDEGDAYTFHRLWDLVVGGGGGSGDACPSLTLKGVT